MANFIYDNARKGFEEAKFNFAVDTLKAALVGAGYTPVQATDTFVSDLGANIVAGTTDQSLASVTDTAGVLNSAAITWPSLPNASVAKYIVIYDSAGGSAGTNRLIACIDTVTGTPSLPVTGNGGSITFTPDSGSNHIFKL